MKMEDALKLEAEIRAEPYEPTAREQALLHIIDYFRSKEPTQEKYNYDQVVEYYRQHLPNARGVEMLNATRKSRLVAQWKAFQEKSKPADRQTFEKFWEAVFAYAAKSDFLSGRVPNSRSWVPNFDFFTQASSLLKLREGVYHGSNNAKLSRSEEREAAQERFLETFE